MLSNEKTLGDLRLADLHATAEVDRLARKIRDAAEPTHRWTITRFIRLHRTPAAA
jgi:hypothetical protein